MSLIFEPICQEDLAVGVSTSLVVSNPGGGSLTGKQICLASFGVGQASETATWAPGAIASGGYATTTIAVTSAAVGDYVVASHDKILTSALMLTAHVSAAGTVTVVLYNPTAGSITPASGSLKVLCLASR